jgi:hypothetical protein
MHLGLSLEDERNLSDQLGADATKFTALANRISWGINMPHLVRLNVDKARRKLLKHCPDSVASHVIDAFTLSALSREKEAKVSLSRARERSEGSPFSYLLPTDAEWNAEVPSTALEEIVPETIWRYRTWFMPTGSRFPWSSIMTIVRTQGGDLALINPVELGDDLVKSLAELGDVRWLVATTGGHDRYLEDAVRAFPDAKLLGVTGLATSERAKHLELAEVMDVEANELPDEFVVLPLNGRMMSDVQLFHEPTKTLISTHLSTANLRDVEPNSFGFRVYCFCWGIHDRVGWLGYHVVFWEDVELLKTNLGRILDTGFERVLDPHLRLGAWSPELMDELRSSMEWIGGLSARDAKQMKSRYFRQQPGFLVDFIRYKLTSAG